MKHNERNLLLLEIQAQATLLVHKLQQVLPDERNEYFITIRQLEELLMAERDLS